MNNAVRLIISIAVPQIAGIASGLATVQATREWYPTLVKPSCTPPSWVFGPVWTLLYIMMGVAAFLVWKKGLDESGAKTALSLFLIQMGLSHIIPSSGTGSQKVLVPLTLNPEHAKPTRVTDFWGYL